MKIIKVIFYPIATTVIFSGIIYFACSAMFNTLNILNWQRGEITTYVVICAIFFIISIVASIQTIGKE